MAVLKEPALIVCGCVSLCARMCEYLCLCSPVYVFARVSVRVVCMKVRVYEGVRAVVAPRPCESRGAGLPRNAAGRVRAASVVSPQPPHPPSPLADGRTGGRKGCGGGGGGGERRRHAECGSRSGGVTEGTCLTCGETQSRGPPPSPRCPPFALRVLVPAIQHPSLPPLSSFSLSWLRTPFVLPFFPFRLSAFSPSPFRLDVRHETQAD